MAAPVIKNSSNKYIQYNDWAQMASRLYQIFIYFLISNKSNNIGQNKMNLIDEIQFIFYLTRDGNNSNISSSSNESYLIYKHHHHHNGEYIL